MTIIQNRKAKKLLVHFYNELDPIPKESKLEDEPEIKDSDVSILRLEVISKDLWMIEMAHIRQPDLIYKATYFPNNNEVFFDIFRKEKAVRVSRGKVVSDGQVNLV